MNVIKAYGQTHSYSSDEGIRPAETIAERPKPSQVKSTIDLRLFEKILRVRNQGGIHIGKGGDVALSYGIGSKLPEGVVRLDFFVGPDGSVVFLKQNPEGEFEFRPKDKNGKRCWCGAVEKKLEQRGITLPARYDAEWDEELGGWIGRLVR